MRATIVVSVDDPQQVAVAEAWFARWRPHLSYCSENTGCGCCVDIWDVDAPDEAVGELPDEMSGMSDWAYPPLAPADPIGGSIRARLMRSSIRRGLGLRPRREGAGDGLEDGM